MSYRKNKGKQTSADNFHFAPFLPSQLRIPPVEWSLDHRAGVIDNAMCERVVLKSEHSTVDLCGGLHKLPQLSPGGGDAVKKEDVIMFVGSPFLTSVEEMADVGLFMADFPPHDMTGEQVSGKW